MTGGAVLREAWRNIITGTTRVTLFAALLTMLSAGLAALEVTTVQAISAAAHRYVAAGASIMTLRAPGRISGAACDALSDVRGVRAAGAVRPMAAPLVAAVLPSSPLPEFEVTAGILAILDAGGRGGVGVVLSDEAASELGVTVGDDLATADDAVPVAGTFAYPSDGRRPGYGYAVLAPVMPGGTFDECGADVWPPSRQTAALLRTTLIAGGDDDNAPVLAQLNPTWGASFDGPARFDDRVTRFAAWPALLLAGGLGYVSVRRRRLELASALHAGVRRGLLGAMLAVETAAWTIPAGVLTAATIALLLVTGGSHAAGALWILAARIGFSASVGAFLGAAVALIETRERHLFRYFKDR